MKQSNRFLFKRFINLRYTKPITGFLVVSGFAFFAVAGHLLAQTAQVQTGNAALRASLSGGEEVPPVSTNATGTFNMDENGSYTLAVSATGVTAAHLHCGARGENGPAIVMLFASTNGENFTNREITGNIKREDFLAPSINCSPKITTMGHLTQAVREGKIYVNVHTVANPNGEIRGQVMANGTISIPTRPAPGSTNTVVDSGDLRIYEMGTNDAANRTFMITINSRLLTELEGLFHHFMGIMNNQQFQLWGQNMPQYGVNSRISQ